VGELSPWHWAIVIVVLVVLFGSRRLPDAARSIGRSARILKAELRTAEREAPSTPPPAPEPEAPATDSTITTSQSHPLQN
jgi:sec-independent protein translocase protein TatA